MFYTCSSCRTACYVFFWNPGQCYSASAQTAHVSPLSFSRCQTGSCQINQCCYAALQKKGVYPPSGCIPQLINIQQGGLRVCVMDGCRWGVWQLINALIISSEDLPLLPELTEWAVCGLTSNAVFRARPLLSALPGSHSFSSHRETGTFCAAKVSNSDETVQQGVLGSLPLQGERKTTFQFRLLMFTLCIQKWSCPKAQHMMIGFYYKWNDWLPMWL